MQPLPNSLWARTAIEAAATPPLAGDATADCAIVGAGFTGLSAALHLAQRGIRTVLLEANEPGWGASGRNGGQVIPGLKLDPSELRALYGQERGARLATMAAETADLVFDLIERCGIACDAHRGGWLQAAAGPRGLAQVRARAEAWAAEGADVGFIDGEQAGTLIGGGNYIGAFLARRGGTLNPLSYARGLARAATLAGASIHGASAATALERTGGRWTISAGNGRVTAGNVLLCTNGYTDRLWPGLAETVIPILSSVLATEPLTANVRQTILPGRHGVSDTRRLLSWFNIDSHGRLVFGGRAAQNETPDANGFRPILARLKSTFPQLGEPRIAFRWAGYVALTPDGVPHLHEPAPNLYAGLGYNGRGVAMSTTMGKLLADRVAGARNEDSPLPVTPLRRIPFHGWRAPAISLAIGWKRLQDRLHP